MRVSKIFLHKEEYRYLQERYSIGESTQQKSLSTVPAPPRFIVLIHTNKQRLIIDTQTGILWPKVPPRKKVPNVYCQISGWETATITDCEVWHHKEFPLPITASMANAKMMSTLFSNAQIPYYHTGFKKRLVRKKVLERWFAIFHFITSPQNLTLELQHIPLYSKKLQPYIKVLNTLLLAKDQCASIQSAEQLHAYFDKHLSTSHTPTETKRGDIIDGLLEKSHAQIPAKPKLPRVTVDDPEQGLIDAALQEPPTDEYISVPLPQEIYPADISKLIKRQERVGIDFGSSSTVIGIEKAKKIRLVRMNEAATISSKDKHYENPTILRFAKDQSLQYWRTVPHNPPLLWEDVQSSHRVQEHIKDLHRLKGLPSIRSIVPHLKIWAREQKERSISIQGKDYTLQPLTNKQFTPQVPISLDDSPLDPIEIYAWHIGLTINNEHSGYHFRYFLTFPVQYEEEVKQQILASFQRGLSRSIPAAVWQHPQAPAIQVKEYSNEPCAFAYGALKAHKLHRFTEPTPFAVFDFGGGTTDFAFGIGRKTTEEEERKHGNKKVIEYFYPSGDVELGGEKILHTIIFLICTQNRTLLNSHKIPYTLPANQDPIVGCEHLASRSSYAQSNTLLLMEEFRDLWELREEPAKYSSDESISISLYSSDGTLVDVQFSIDQEPINAYIDTRIKKGFETFLHGIHYSFQDKNISNLHVFLAGNASRRPEVQSLFQTETLSSHLAEKWEGTPTIHTHKIEPKMSQEQIFTCKTGVVVGLLELLSASKIQVQNSVSNQSFAYFVGIEEDDIFEPKIMQHDDTKDWIFIDTIPAASDCALFFSSSPLANSDLELPHPDIHDIILPEQPTISYLFIKIQGQHHIEYGFGSSNKEPPHNNITKIDLRDYLP